MLKYELDDLHRNVQSLINHLIQSFEDTFFKIEFIDGSDIEPFYGKASKDALPISTAPEYMLESQNPIILIYHVEDRRKSILGIKKGTKLSKIPILIITVDEVEESFDLHFNVEVKFFYITAILYFMYEITDKVNLKDVFGFYIDTVRVKQKEKWQEIECFNFGDFFDHETLYNAIKFVKQHCFSVAKECMKKDYAFCLDLTKGYDPKI